MKFQKGFTLVELLVVTVIIGILASIAYPSYTQYVTKSDRASAQAFMLKIASREEQYLLDARTYANSLATLSLTPPAELSRGGNVRYTFTIVVVTSALDANVIAGAALPQYIITATAAGAQLNDGNLTLNSLGVKSPAAKWQ